MDLTLSVLDRDGAPRATGIGDGEAFLIHRAAYAEGDVLAVEAAPGAHVMVSLDEALPAALVFLREGRLAMPVPFGADRDTYSPKAFYGAMHRLQVRLARPEEIEARRDLALNPYDGRFNDAAFPHASANVETRGEAVFAARNAIDGECANDDHGFWPYTSWGINRDPNAALSLDFGRPVEIDSVALTLRADFPHDAWWREATFVFDGTDTQTVELTKSGRRQTFEVQPRTVSSVRLERLIKADDPSPFPALTRIEVFGRDQHGCLEIS